MFLVLMTIFLNVTGDGKPYLEEKVFKCSDIVDIKESNEEVSIHHFTVNTCIIKTKQVSFKVGSSCNKVVEKHKEYCR